MENLNKSLDTNIFKKPVDCFLNFKIAFPRLSYDIYNDYVV